jgi:DNA-binding transcriptional LysR family regulator
LLTVFETSSLAETARRFNVTPSAVIQRVRALEREIGQPLIVRSGHLMRPTAAGNAIIADMQRILAAASDLKAAASINLGVGRIRVGVVQTVLTGLLPDVLIALKRNWPGLGVEVFPGVSRDLYSAVASGDLDLAMLVKPHFVLPKTLNWVLLRTEPLLLLTPRPLKESDPANILKSWPFIRYDRKHWGGRIVDLYLRKLKIRPNELFELDSLEAIAILVNRGLGVSLVPDWLPPWPKGVNVKKIKMAGAPPRSIGVLWSKSSTRLPLIRAFVDEVWGMRPTSHRKRP